MIRPIASTDLKEVLQPRPMGEPVNSHVVAPAPEPKPDFDAMQRMIEGLPSEEVSQKSVPQE